MRSENYIAALFQARNNTSK